jgi:hypothetical protein
MKHRPFFNIFLAVSIVGVSMLACLSANPKPPHYGVFFQQNGEWMELQEQEIFTIPVEREMSNSKAISDSQPSIVIWRTETNLDYLELYKLNQYLGQSDKVRYDATPLDDGIITITPSSPLEDGIYCLIQGDPLAILLSGWCFRVEDKLGTIPTKQSELNNDPISVESSTPQPTGLIKEWTIKTGNIRFIGVDSDGSIYGMGANLYAIISKDGEVLQTNEVDLTDCLTRVAGGSGDVEIDYWSIIKPGGIILTYEGGCKISPGNPPVVERRTDDDYFPYADDLEPHLSPDVPDGFVNYHSLFFVSAPNPYMFHSRRNERHLFLNADQRMAAFINHNGTLSYFELPADLDLEKHLSEIRFAITPWDDVYYRYQAYDSLGNGMGLTTIKIDADGSSEIMKKTLNVDERSIESVVDIAGIQPIYLAEREELYLFQRDSLGVYDLDFNLLGKYQLPADIPQISNGTVNFDKRRFVGHDGAVYVFDTTSFGQTLTKYSLYLDFTRPRPTASQQNHPASTPDLSPLEITPSPSVEVTSTDNISITVKDTSKGDFLQVQFDGNEYEIGPLEKGTYIIGPNKKFIIYCTNSGSVYAARIGNSNLVRIGDIKDFSIIQRSEAPKLEFEFLGDHPYSVVIYEQILKQSKILEIPRYITSPN